MSDLSTVARRARSYLRVILFCIVFGLILMYVSMTPGGALGTTGFVAGAFLFAAGIVAVAWVLEPLWIKVLELIFMHGYTKKPQGVES